MLQIDKSTGLIKDVTYIPSPNADDRPANAEINLLVIHNISLPPKQFDNSYIIDFFLNRLDSSIDPYFKEIENLQVSAHALIRRDGEIIQFVPLERRAWHAGTSQFDGKQKCNDYSIGIELEGADDIPYTNAQYAKLAELTLAVCACYPHINKQRIVGHSDIAPGRKTDPGSAFDWDYYFQLLQ